jgi:hypothetical protein
MFSNSRDISTDAAEGLGSEQGSEAPGDFLFYFGHSKVSFGKIIVKRHVKIIHECQRLTRVFGQTIQQIASGRLLFSTTTSWYFWFSDWIGSVAVYNNRFVSSLIFGKRLLRKVVSSRRFGPVHGFLNMTKQFTIVVAQRCLPCSPIKINSRR